MSEPLQISAPRQATPAALLRTGTFADLAFIATLAFLTVVDLFAAQALLPSLTHRYGVSPGAMGLAVNACTLGMAAGGLGIALWGDRLPRRSGIAAALALLFVPTLLLAIAPALAAFAALRVLQGLAMATAFGLTLAYLAEHYDASFAPSAFAAYITGNVASNLLGRLIATTIADHAGTGAAFIGFAALNVVGAALAFTQLRTTAPVPRHAHGPTGSAALRSHLQDPTLRAGFVLGFCILFAFIGVFTFINFVLVAPPLSLGMMQVGLVYFVFVPSIVTTPLAGHVVLRIGPRASLAAGLGLAASGLPLLLASSIDLILAGMTLVAIGTFFAQAVATGVVSRTARENKGAASGLYLASYFLGGLAGTAAIGTIYDAYGWPPCLAAIGGVIALALMICARRLP